MNTQTTTKANANAQGATTYTDLKAIKTFCDNNNIDDWKEIAENLINTEDDFEVNDYRFIRSSKIDAIQQEELTNDLYILGCFNADFIADNTNLSYNAVTALQDADAYEALGEIMEPNIEEIQSEYARLDGYGHHFNRYDGNEIEQEFIGEDYYVFRVN